MTDTRLQWSKSIDHWMETFNTDAQQPVCDVLVIGSGYGGSFAARELAEPQNRVWVMERGREYALGEFPEDIGIFPANVNVQAQTDAELVGYSDALLELRRFDQVSVLVGSGLGGGSLINAGVALRPDDALLDQASWPHHYRQNPAGRNTLCAAMAEVEQVLQVAPLSDARSLRKFQSLEVLGKSMGLRTEPAPLTIASHDQVSPAGVEQKACTRCGNCFTGCNVGAKNTMATHVIPDAHRKGAEFFTGATAVEVLPAKQPNLRTPAGRAARWSVRMVCTQGQNDVRTRREFVVHAHTLVLAAGAVGSTEILLHSPKVAKSPLLGTRFSTNGDVLAMGWGMRTRVNGMGIVGADTSVLQSPDDRVGPTITGVLRAPLTMPNGDSRTVLIEEGAVPSALTQLTVALGSTLSLPHRYTGPEGPGYFSSDWSTDRLATPTGMERHAMLMLGMGPDDADGVMSLQTTKKGKPKLAIRWNKPDTGPEAPFYQAVHEWMNKAAAEKDGFQGGDYLPNPLWQALPEDFNAIAGGGGKKQGITVHPLGGCPMGDDASTGVVDWRGTVFKPDGGLHAGLHVLDGAMLPSAVGVNPFLTIASLSLVAARNIRDDLYAAAPAVVPAPESSTAALAQGHVPSPRKAGGEPVTLRFQEHLQGHWRGLAPEWLPELDPSLTLEERTRAWVVSVDVVLDVDQWVASPSSPLRGALLRIYRNPTPQDITVHPDACQGTPVLEGTGQVTLLALDAPRDGWDQFTRIVSAMRTFSQRRGIKEIFQLAGSGTPRPGESKLGSVVRSIKGFLRAARNLSFHRELIYSFTLHKPEQPQFMVQAEGRKRLAYTPEAKNVWDALVEIDLKLSPHNGQNAATLSITADLIDMVRNHRLQVAKAVNTPAGMIAMASFAALWLRVIFQTHFWSFRGLDYDTLRPPKPAEHGPLKGAQAPQRFTLPVPRYTDNSDGTKSAEMLHLELTCYVPSKTVGAASHLLMVHGLAHGGTVFTTHTTDGNNMAAAFVDAGYTVWVLDHRLSNRLPYFGNDHCMDDVAALDIPAAVRHVYQTAGNTPIAVFAHCVGGGAFAMATLKGWLMDPATQTSMVGKAIIHAVHPWVVPSASNQLSGSLAVLYKDLLPDGMSINPVPPSGKSEALDQVLDRLGASLPWPETELDLHRKDQFDPQGGTATCNRMTLFYGREWVHGNLNPATHRELASLVGPASVEVFRQLFFIVNRHRLTDRDGASVYLTAEQFKANWNFPILFAHGSANKVFDPRSAVRSWSRMRALQTGRVVRMFMADGYGHMDFLFGQNAHRDVYPHLCEFLHNPATFRSSWGAEQDEQYIPNHLRDFDATEPRKPVVGSHIRLSESGETTAPQRALVLWTVFPNDPTRTADAPVLKYANGQPLSGWSATRLQHIHLNPTQDRKTTLLHGPGAYWCGQLVEAKPGEFQNLDSLQMDWGDAGQLGHTMLALTHLNWWKRWIGTSVQHPVSWLALSCRWPGTPFEGEAIDAVAVQMQAHVSTSTLPVDALVMLGDQIYADSTANMFKTRENDEVLAGMYRDAWGSPHAQALLASVPSYTVVDDHEYGDNWSGAVDASQDAVFVNGFEAALAYQWRWHEGATSKYRSAPVIDGPHVTGFWNAFKVGGVPFFGADTRSERQLRSPENYRTQPMVSHPQLAAIKAWLLEFKDQPKVLCSGSVMGFVERDLWEAPGKCITGDSWDGYPATWRELVRFIVAQQIQNLVFLSGDYHFSGITELELHAQGSQPPVRALSVACSGWNATLPFANAVPQDFVTGQWADYPGSDDAVRARCLTHPLSTTHRQFSKLTLTHDAQQMSWLTVRVYDGAGELKNSWRGPLATAT